MTRVVVQNIKNYEGNEYRRFRDMVSASKRERIDRYKHIVDYRRSLKKPAGKDDRYGCRGTGYCEILFCEE